MARTRGPRWRWTTAVSETPCGLSFLHPDHPEEWRTEKYRVLVSRLSLPPGLVFLELGGGQITLRHHCGQIELLEGRDPLPRLRPRSSDLTQWLDVGDSQTRTFKERRQSSSDV